MENNMFLMPRLLFSSMLNNIDLHDLFGMYAKPENPENSRFKA